MGRPVAEAPAHPMVTSALAAYPQPRSGGPQSRHWGDGGGVHNGDVPLGGR